MRARRLLLALLIAPPLLAGCNGIPKPKPTATSSAQMGQPKVGPGTVVTDALTQAHCISAGEGAWTANGVVKNTTDQTRSFDVNIYVGPPDGTAGVAQVVKVKNLEAGKSAPWKADYVQATSASGPCYIRVRVAT